MCLFLKIDFFYLQPKPFRPIFQSDIDKKANFQTCNFRNYQKFKILDPLERQKNICLKMNPIAKNV